MCNSFGFHFSFSLLLIVFFFFLMFINVKLLSYISPFSGSLSLSLTLYLYLCPLPLIIIMYCQDPRGRPVVANKKIKKKQSIETNPTIKIQCDADLFVSKLKENEKNLHEQFEWIEDFSLSVKQSCTLVPKSVWTIRFCSYIFVFYNTIMMHFLLQGKLPVTITSVLPLLLSLIGTSISPSNIIFFVIIELMQAVIAVTITKVAFARS
jgi:hypothetical protein